jgi:hypothetical protein
MTTNLTGTNPSIERHSDAPQAATRWPLGAIGEDNPRAVLTTDQVLAIYSSKEPVKDLAHRYGVNRNTVSMIRHGRRWAWLTQGQDRAEDGAA